MIHWYHFFSLSPCTIIFLCHLSLELKLELPPTEIQACVMPLFSHDAPSYLHRKKQEIIYISQLSKEWCAIMYTEKVSKKTFDPKNYNTLPIGGTWPSKGFCKALQKYPIVALYTQVLSSISFILVCYFFFSVALIFCMTILTTLRWNVSLFTMNVGEKWGASSNRDCKNRSFM